METDETAVPDIYNINFLMRANQKFGLHTVYSDHCMSVLQQQHGTLQEEFI